MILKNLGALITIDFQQLIISIIHSVPCAAALPALPGIVNSRKKLDTSHIVSWHRLLRRKHFLFLFFGRLFRPW